MIDPDYSESGGSLKGRAVRGFLWDFSGKFARQGLSFVIGIILARLLLPEDFGLIAMVMVFVGLVQGFSGLGLGAAIIQRKDLREAHLDSVFLVNLLAAGLLSVGLFVAAPLVASFYRQPVLVTITRALTLLPFISALSMVQVAILRRHLSFGVLTVGSFAGNVVGGTAGIWMAVNGWGVWALVATTLISPSVSGAVYWAASAWRPARRFEWRALKELWSYGFNMYLAGVLNQSFERLDALVIGRMFNAYDLGLYNRAKALNRFVIKFSSDSIAAVSFPVLASIQDETERLREASLLITSVVSFLSFGLIGLLYLIAEPLILLLLTEKWLPSVHFFRLLCFSAYVYPISASVLSILKASGRSADFLRLEIVKKVVYVIGLTIGFHWGIEGFIISLAVTGAINLVLNMYVSGRPVSLPIWKQLRNILPDGILAIACVVIIQALLTCPPILVQKLSCLILVFGGSYLGGALLLRRPGLRFAVAQTRPVATRLWRSLSGR